MEIIEVKKNWPADRFLIHYMLHNVCNYKCWYCFPGSNEGNHRWPDIEVALPNLKHLINVYRQNFNKKVFELNFLGGEPTLWPELSDLVTGLKKEYGKNIIISITTNGTRSIRWWEEYGHQFDKVLISCHPERVDPYHISQVADLLYNKMVLVDVKVLMDPSRWDTCLNIISTLKESKRRWSIQTAQVIGSNIRYTQEQLEYLKQYMKRSPNLFWFWRCNNNFNYNVRIVDEQKNSKKVKKNYLLLKNLNHFKGWSCNIGIENLNINALGYVSSACNEKLYGYDFNYNLYDEDFIKKFNPQMVPAICSKTSCDCEYEFNTSKKKKNSL